MKGDGNKMTLDELKEIIRRGEDGVHQFKETLQSPDSLAAELVAFSNARGGTLLLGVSDRGEIHPLSEAEVRRLNSMISTAASQHVRPPVNPSTENVAVESGVVIVLRISEGLAKSYMDNSGLIWVKSGADKRKVTSREEIQRMFQSAGLLHADEIPANGMGLSELDHPFFDSFYRKEYEEEPPADAGSLSLLLENMNLARDGIFNVAGALLFSRAPQYKLPSFSVKAVAFPGSSLEEVEYLDSRDLVGRISEIYKGAVAFILNNLHWLQAGQSVNSIGQPEIPRIVLEELVANALVHRDYFTHAPIRILVFADRVEIISPGHLPNNLTVEHIKRGNSNIRNPVLASFAAKILPYRGLGSGIKRALRAHPQIDFIDDREGNLFTARIRRPARADRSPAEANRK